MAEGKDSTSPFSDNYQLLEEIGVGSGYAKIKRAVHKCSGVIYATKIFDTTVYSYNDLEHEIETLKKLQHPYIVRLHDVIVEEPVHYMIMEYVIGGELFEDIVKREYYSEADASQCMQQILEAIKYCHFNGILHMDLKPENILLSSKDKGATIKLVDFGCSIEIQGDEEQEWSGLVGTPNYMSPEIIGGIPYGKPVDIWACGVILCTLLVGVPPFYDADEAVMFRRIMARDYNYQLPEWDTVSSEGKIIIDQMLTLDARKRITAAEALEQPWISHWNLVASRTHKQNTVDSLTEFNARRKFKGAIITTVIATSVLPSCSNNLKDSLDVTKPGIRTSTLQETQEHRTCSHMFRKYNDEAQGSESIMSAFEDCDLSNDSTFENSGGAVTEPSSFICADILHYTKLLAQAFNDNYELVFELCDPEITIFDCDVLPNLVEGLELYMSLRKPTTTTTTKPKQSSEINSSATILNPKVHLLGKGVAVVAYVCSGKFVDAEGRQSSRLSKESVTWHRRQNRWTAVHLHRSYVNDVEFA